MRSPVCRDAAGTVVLEGLVVAGRVAGGAAGAVITAGGCAGRCFSAVGAIRGKRLRKSRLSRCMMAGGAVLGGVCLTTGIRVSRSGCIRGLPGETATETDVAAEGVWNTVLPRKKSFCRRMLKPPRTLRFL